MRRALVALALGAFAAAGAEAQVPVVTPRAGLVITHSVRLRPGTYRLGGPESPDSALIVVRGDNVTVDMRGAAFEGIPAATDPDDARGVAILIDGGRNVRLRGPRLRGYKVAILARGTRGLRIEGGDLSHNWKPRMFSQPEHESLADWLSYHRNDAGEWLRFGAAIYLDGVRGGEITGVTARQGMNGLLLTRSDSVRIEGNNFSFNSGLGIGMYRSSDNTILYNRVDYNVRGYSHGRYRRGQDSAGILIYEQSCRNVVAWNSVTHGGDGLFLWAGQTTMDSGTGGANDNLFYGNDFSYAPTNGMEATFSRNTFVANRVVGNDHGLWGGYSWASRVVGNDFGNNRIGIAIEHGQDNMVRANRFHADTTAIRVWANPIEPSDWGYPRHRDTRSRDLTIEGNTFARNRVALRALNTDGITVADNRFIRSDTVFVLGDTARFAETGNARLGRDDPGNAADIPELPAEFARLAPEELGQRRRPTSPLARLDRSAIVVDEWGPYDWRSPKLWPVDSTRAVPLRLAVLGPPGRWRLVAARRATLSAAEGRTGDTVTVTPVNAADWAVELEYRGAATVSPRGVRRAAGLPYRFSWSRFEPVADWAIRFFTWSDSTDPRTRGDEFTRLLASAPLMERRAPRLDYMWYRPIIPGLPLERWALEATAAVELAPGSYTLRTISDDGVRVWVDGSLVIDNWSLHESAVDHAALAGGRHALRVQYFQVGGWTELRLDILRGTERSRGSPGPH